MARIALIGTGFVADYYSRTLANHANLVVAGAFDIDAARLEAFCRFHGHHSYASLEAALADDTVDIVVNLAPPQAHFEINRLALEAGRHVYCEKPLAMEPGQAAELVDLANSKGLFLSGAPANALSDAQILTARLIEEGRIGTPRLVYAEMEDGAVFRDNWQEWRSASGAPWPGMHEFEIGCTLEHAGYALSWLFALFGRAKSVQSFSALAFPDKGPGTENLAMASDFSVGCIEFASGPVARITCGLAAPRDRSLTIVGDAGTIIVRDLWDDRSPVHLSRFGEKDPFVTRLLKLYERKSGKHLPGKLFGGHVVPYPANGGRKLPRYPSRIDFAAGIADLAKAIEGGTAPLLTAERAVHLTELALALGRGGAGMEFH
ncbi:Gfo/Idh/MocA family oxidoreductase [Pseudohoeflea suaedae]|uniref:Gfo/Idh/MocA family oxidoreductase n=1 Tax=Pseudohoeflea suaedae TaxID=877384 RepID=A0A4R5PIR4_9HYPH|nr:Gfo/Idh/MocA family oxidoreductase [Pseudohoeflea suaedae]TDH34431.1 Gfo/Idh/MocA family oxidoreductase [Pseudohoeflea suaedae]